MASAFTFGVSLCAARPAHAAAPSCWGGRVFPMSGNIPTTEFALRWVHSMGSARIWDESSDSFVDAFKPDELRIFRVCRLASPTANDAPLAAAARPRLSVCHPSSVMR